MVDVMDRMDRMDKMDMMDEGARADDVQGWAYVGTKKDFRFEI